MKAFFYLLGLIGIFCTSICSHAIDISWTNTVGGNWSVASNWSPNQVPDYPDSAILTNDGNYTVTVDTNAAVTELIIGSTTGNNTQALLLTGQQFTVIGPTTVNLRGDFTLNNGSLFGPVTVCGSLNWSGGVLNQNAPLTVAAGGVLNAVGNFVVNAPLTNNGTVNVQGGQITMNECICGDMGAIWNQAGGQWNIKSDASIGYYKAEPNFNNAGTITKKGTSGTTFFDVVLNNTGTVQVQSGAITFLSGGNLGGNFKADVDAAINFMWTFNPYNFSPNSWNVAADFEGPGVIKILNASDPIRNRTTIVAVTGATTNLMANGVIVSGLSNIYTANLVNCTNSDDETIMGTINLSGGEIFASGALTIATNGVLNLIGDFTIDGPLTNNGTVNWQDGDIYLFAGDGAIIWNQAGAQWNLQCDQTLLSTNGTGIFYNSGTITKDDTTALSVIDPYLINSGQINANRGSIVLNNGASLGGFIVFEINSTNDFGSIYVAGTAAFGGMTANVIFKGTYEPHVNDSFNLAFYGSLASSNGYFNGISLPNSVVCQTNYGPSAFSFSILSDQPTGQPTISGFKSYFSGTNAVTGSRTVTLTATINPNGLSTMAFFQYGLTTNYLGSSATMNLAAGNVGTNVSAILNSIVPGVVYHWQTIASNGLGVVASPDQIFFAAPIYPPGETNADGVVDQNELNAVLANYWPNSPWVIMTNVAGLGSINVQFALTNANNWDFSVLVSTNLNDWEYLGRATPMYQFIDPKATNRPTRFYQLRWP